MDHRDMEEPASPGVYPLELLDIKIEVADSPCGSPTPCQDTNEDELDSTSYVKLKEESFSANDDEEDPLQIRNEDIEESIAAPAQDVSPVKPDVTLYPCILCDKLFTTKRGMSVHLASHKDNPLSGLIKRRNRGEKGSGDNTKKNKPVWKYIKTVDAEGNTTYTCPLCGKVFTSSGSLNGHKKHHLKPSYTRRPRMCEICGKVCPPTRNAFKRHVLTHRIEKRYECDMCKTTFNGKSKLARHINNHLNAGEYGCDLCKKTFTLHRYLVCHKWRVHNPNRPLAQHACVVCGKSFNVKGNLAVHVKTHTNEKEFQCDICFMQFTRRGDVTRHKKVVHGNLLGNPLGYKCDLCQLSFRSSASRKRHRDKVHLKIRHQCDICLKWYTYKSTVVYHKEKVHGVIREDKWKRRDYRPRESSKTRGDTDSSELSDVESSVALSGGAILYKTN